MTLLPQLGYKKLHSVYRQDEPWDSEHNNTVLTQMPDVYRSEGDEVNSTNSSYFVFTGEESVFPSDRACSYANIMDGSDSTLLVVESKRDVPWTKPEDIAYDAKDALSTIGGWHPDGFDAVTCAGDLQFFPLDFDKTSLKYLIMRKDCHLIQMPQPYVRENDARSGRRR